ncbi:hypothetical protein [Chitinibacter tainanensis]|uniref:hypothetical protein n=1 Tax=Chitinibacter tainanensis TaxID=230667 RepID=UPI0009FB985E|nr:hypothetical protein [Chitinibacter tainanensis]
MFPGFSNNVDIGCDSVLLGGIPVVTNVVIGANSVVIKDAPDKSIGTGNLAQIISSNNNQPLIKHGLFDFHSHKLFGAKYF